MKKSISVLLVLMLLVSAIPGFAVAANKQLTTEDYAYMDILNVSDEVGNLVLAARQAIIYGDQAWTVNGATAIIHADGTVEAIPEFSDLYPDWDLPSAQSTNLQFARGMARLRAENEANTETPASVNAAKATTPGHVIATRNVWLANPVGDISSGVFHSFNASGATVVTGALTLPTADYRFNIGYSNADSQEDISWFPNLVLGDTLALLKPTSGERYSVRASTYGNPGQSIMEIKEID